MMLIITVNSDYLYGHMMSENSSFGKEVQTKVHAYFKAHQLSEHANGAAYFRVFTLLGLFFGIYFTIMFGGISLMASFFLCILMGVVVAGTGFSVGHDANHGSFSNKAWVNHLLGFSFELVGANSYMWKITHNTIHHTYTNIYPLDDDLDSTPLLRMSPYAAYKPFHRFQHWYAIPAYSLATFVWALSKDFVYFSKKDLGPFKNKKHPKKEVVLLFVYKAFYYFFFIALPLMILPITFGQFMMGYLAMHFTAGIILGVTFQLAHLVQETSHVLPNEKGNFPDGWAVHQMHTTANFDCTNKLLTFYVGGLNFQIEHHLFPRVCSIHYPAIRPIVMEVAKKYGVPYHENPTFISAVRSHVRTLKLLSRPPVSMPTQSPIEGNAIAAGA
jgi:linoleoyl-CoA desaturase